MTTSSKWGGARTNAKSIVYICKRVCNEKAVKQGSKNISIKMLKDVGMTVPKSRETSAVYIYAAIQGMRDYIYMQQDKG